MKNKGLIIVTLSILMVSLVGCGSAQEASSSIAPTSVSTSEPTSAPTSLSTSESQSSAPTSKSEMPTVDWDDKDFVAKGGNYGGFFTEINIGRQLCSDSSYTFLFQSSLAGRKDFTVKVSNPDLAEAVKDGLNHGFSLNTKAVGDFILTIENADEILVYRNIVRVRKAIALDEMDDYLQNVDKFVSPAEYEKYYGSYRLAFILDKTVSDKVTGTLKGSDDYDQNVNIVFTYEYEMFLEDRDCYSYKLTTIYQGTDLTYIEYFNITRCGDWMYVYEDAVKGTGGLLALLVPSK